MLHLRIIRGPGKEDWLSVSETGMPFTVGREDADLVKQPQELLMIVRTLMNGGSAP